MLDLDFAFTYTGYGDFDKVFHYLNRTIDQRMGIACTGIIYCIRYPLINEGIKADPRYNQLLERIGLT